MMAERNDPPSMTAAPNPLDGPPHNLFGHCLECGGQCRLFAPEPPLSGERPRSGGRLVSEELIDEGWLRHVGFLWHQHERQPTKHWILWLGRAIAFCDSQELGIEVASGAAVERRDEWFCWLRSDLAHRYHRFIHVRHLRTRAEVVRLVEALTGQAWDPANHFFGMVLTPEAAEVERERGARFDRLITLERPHPGPHEVDVSEIGAIADDLQGPRLPRALRA